VCACDVCVCVYLCTWVLWVLYHCNVLSWNPRYCLRFVSKSNSQIPRKRRNATELQSQSNSYINIISQERRRIDVYRHPQTVAESKSHMTNILFSTHSLYIAN